MKKRFLAVTILIALFAALLPGCTIPPPPAKEGDLTLGQWAQMLSDTFGMFTYQSGTPYNALVPADDPYFAAVQAACEWNAFPGLSFKTDDKLTKALAASSLVRTVGLYDTGGLTEPEIAEYAYQNNYISFAVKGSAAGAGVSREEAEASLKSSFAIWTDRSFDNTETVEYGDGTAVIPPEAVQSPLYARSGNRVTLPRSVYEALGEIAPGMQIVLPPDQGGGTMMFTVTAVDGNSEDGTAVLSVTPVEIGEDGTVPIQDLKSSYSGPADLTAGVIRDGLGRIVYTGDGNEQLRYPSPGNPVPLSNPAKAVPLADKAAVLSFTVSGFTVSGTVGSDSVKFSVTHEKKLNNSVKAVLSSFFEINNLRIDSDADIEWFKVKSAYSKLSYETKTGINAKVDLNKTFYKYDGTMSLGSELSEAVLDSYDKASHVLTICSMPLFSAGIVSARLEIRVRITAGGQAELLVTTNNLTGFEYSKGSFRAIKDQSAEVTAEMKGEAELTLYGGLSLSALGFSIAGLGAEGGLGAKAKLSVWLYNTSSHSLIEAQVYGGNSALVEEAALSLRGQSAAGPDTDITVGIDTCFDIQCYAILKFKFDTDTVVGKLLKGKTTEYTVFDESNSSLLQFHFEDGHRANTCTRSYEGEEEPLPSPPPDASGSGTPERDIFERIDIDTWSVTLSPGNTHQLNVSRYPAGYTPDGIVYSSDNPSVCEINGSGLITAKDAGTALVTVQTSDGLYAVSCAVTVFAPEETTFQPLS